MTADPNLDSTVTGEGPTPLALILETVKAWKGILTEFSEEKPNSNKFLLGSYACYPCEVQTAIARAGSLEPGDPEATQRLHVKLPEIASLRTVTTESDSPEKILSLPAPPTDGVKLIAIYLFQVLGKREAPPWTWMKSGERKKLFDRIKPASGLVAAMETV